MSRQSPVGEWRVVAIGGGSGLAVLLRGLKQHVGKELETLTAVVTVSDDGGSSGRLRRELGVLPPGDIRNCIVALADDEDLLSRLFQYRFPNGEGLSGHSFGNLLLTALAGITGDFYQAILTAEEILAVRGKILPATMSDVRLVSRGISGQVYEGESAIGESGERLTEIGLEPAGVQAFPAAIEAIDEADLILLGPGSLYTSILPNLLIGRIGDAVARSSASVVLVMNLMTQPGETDAMNGGEHLEALERHLGRNLIDVILTYDDSIAPERLEGYAETGAEAVGLSRAEMESRGVRVVARNLLADGPLIRHDPTKLSRAILELLESQCAVLDHVETGAGVVPKERNVE